MKMQTLLHRQHPYMAGYEHKDTLWGKAQQTGHYLIDVNVAENCTIKKTTISNSVQSVMLLY